MLDMPIIDVAIGLVFVFAATALLASTVTEAIASLFKLRATTLAIGIGRLLNDETLSGLAKQVFNHALVHPQGNGQLTLGRPVRRWSGAWSWSGPSYIKAESFATAFIEILEGVPSDLSLLKAKIDQIGDPQIKQLLQGIYNRASGDLESIHKELANWFDTSMERVSGAYKRQSQLTTFLVGLAIAALMNIDAIHLADALWRNPALAKELANMSEKFVTINGKTAASKPGTSEPVDSAVKQKADGTRETDSMSDSEAVIKEKAEAASRDVNVVVEALVPLPIGHKGLTGAGWGGITVLIGWLLTATAAVFGAPFWFDLLQNLVRLRGTGPKPTARGERSQP